MIPLKAQYNIRLNNYWDNPFYINSASIDEDYNAKFSIAARKQWIGFPGAPSTLFATATTYLPEIQTQFGLKVFADNIGYSTISNLSLSYAHNVYLNRSWELNLGIAASIQFLTYDRSEVSTLNVDDPALYENLLNESNYNCDLGFQFKNKSWRIGGSSQNLFSAFFKENTIQTNTNMIYAMYRKKTDQTINLQYGVSVIQYANILQMEFNITSFFRFYDQPDLFQVGLLYRTRSEMGLILGYKISDSMHLSYSYDFNVSGISQSSVGSHELIIAYNLNKISFRPYKY